MAIGRAGPEEVEMAGAGVLVEVEHPLQELKNL
jgi:hypothetical protein